MGMLRTICCDVCGKTEMEMDRGAGWQGWCIIQGIAAYEPVEGEPLTDANMSMALCPDHKDLVAEYITELQEDCR